MCGADLRANTLRHHCLDVYPLTRQVNKCSIWRKDQRLQRSAYSVCRSNVEVCKSTSADLGGLFLLYRFAGCLQSSTLHLITHGHADPPIAMPGFRQPPWLLPSGPSPAPGIPRDSQTSAIHETRAFRSHREKRAKNKVYDDHQDLRVGDQ